MRGTRGGLGRVTRHIGIIPAHVFRQINLRVVTS